MKKRFFFICCCLGLLPQLLCGGEWKQSVHKTASFRQLKAEINYDKQPETLLELGKAYYFGWGTKKNLKKARKYLQNAAETNLPEAEMWLADLNTKETKNPALVKQGFDVLLRLAKEDYAPAQYKTAYLYAQSIGTEADAAQSVHWLIRAAENPLPVPQAQTRLAAMYYTGYPPYIEQDKAKAFSLFQAAADAEDPEARYHTARMYLQGEGTEKNEKLAFKYMRLAARDKVVPAQKEVSRMYQNGIGVKADDYSAFKWMYDAARQGDASAQLLTAKNYWQGYGIAKNRKEALFWAFQARANGSKQAENLIQQIKEEN